METVVHQNNGHTLSVLKCKSGTVLRDRQKDVSLLLRSASCCLLEAAETESDTANCTDRLLTAPGADRSGGSPPGSHF